LELGADSTLTAASEYAGKKVKCEPVIHSPNCRHDCGFLQLFGQFFVYQKHFLHFVTIISYCLFQTSGIFVRINNDLLVHIAAFELPNFQRNFKIKQAYFFKCGQP
jgi:hypothetical protein